MRSPLIITSLALLLGGTAFGQNQNQPGTSSLDGLSSNLSPLDLIIQMVWEDALAGRAENSATTDTPTVVGRYIFYNNSYYDVKNNNDADAIDFTKSPLFSGTATFANWTGYSKGINGLIYDVSLPTRTPLKEDFTFRNIGRAGTALPGEVVAPPGFATQDLGAGVIRVLFTFSDNSVQDTWLQVDIGTGFGAAAETHYWGSARYDCGTYSGGYIWVNSTDEVEVRNHLWTSAQPRAPVDWRWNYVKNGFCGSSDSIGARNNMKISTSTAVRVITK